MTTHLPPHTRQKPQPLPPLESGDRLTRPEFERRYAAAPHIKKAELIEGVVYVASPLRHEQHGKPHSRVMTCKPTSMASFAVACFRGCGWQLGNCWATKCSQC